jgi:hypothetical protein
MSMPMFAPVTGRKLVRQSADDPRPRPRRFEPGQLGIILPVGRGDHQRSAMAEVEVREDRRASADRDRDLAQTVAALHRDLHRTPGRDEAGRGQEADLALLEVDVDDPRLKRIAAEDHVDPAPHAALDIGEVEQQHGRLERQRADRERHARRQLARHRTACPARHDRLAARDPRGRREARVDHRDRGAAVEHDLGRLAVDRAREHDPVAPEQLERQRRIGRGELRLGLVHRRRPLRERAAAGEQGRSTGGKDGPGSTHGRLRDKRIKV